MNYIAISIILLLMIIVIIGFVINDRINQEERKIRELEKINMREQRKEIEKELDALEIELKEKLETFDFQGEE